MPGTTSTSAAATQTTEPQDAGLSTFAAWAAALLALGVGWIHVADQGGLPGSKMPTYVGWGYYALELTAVVVAGALAFKRTRHQLATWLAAGAVSVGPLTGYVLSRGPGLPGYTEDRGNWAEPIGLISLVIEGLLLLLAAAIARVLLSPGRPVAQPHVAGPARET